MYGLERDGRRRHGGHGVGEDARRGRRRRRGDGRVDRGYRLYPIESLEPNFHELEYFVHIDRARRRCSRCAS